FAATEADHIAWLQVHEEPPRPSTITGGVDPRLEAIVEKAMSKDVARRHQSARELRADLRALLVPPAARSQPAASGRPTASARPEASVRPPTPSSPGRSVKPAGSVRPPDDDDAVGFFPASTGSGFPRKDAIEIGDIFGSSPAQDPVRL